MYLDIKQLAFAYPGGAPVLNNLHFTMEKGEIVSLLGPSGSGKSTLLRLIAGLDHPADGSIELNGVTLSDPTTFVIPERRNVGMVFQDYALFPHMSVFQNVAFGLPKQSRQEQRKVVLELLRLVNLEAKVDRYPHELSGGEQQRIALARSLATKPDVLLLDEPFSNLDASLKVTLRRDLRRILNTAETTCLIVTHDEQDALAIADRVVRMTEGTIPLK